MLCTDDQTISTPSRFLVNSLPDVSLNALGNSLESLGELAVLVLRQTRVLEARRAAGLSVRTTRAVANEDVGEVHAVSWNIVELNGCVSG